MFSNKKMFFDFLNINKIVAKSISHVNNLRIAMILGIMLLHYTNSLGQVVINEVMVQPQSNSTSAKFQSLSECTQPTFGSEYIELYNADPCIPIDISCYLIGFNTNFGTGGNHGTFRFPAGTIIPPLGFLSIGGPNSGATINLFNFCSTPNLNTAIARWFLPNGDGYLILWNKNMECKN